MKRPMFKDKYVGRFIVEKGECYTVREDKESWMSTHAQKTVFAITLEGSKLSELKDLSIGDSMELLTNKKDFSVNVREGKTITSAADEFDSIKEFESIYERSTISIDKFLKEFLHELSISNKVENEKVSRPSPRKKI